MEAVLLLLLLFLGLRGSRARPVSPPPLGGSVEDLLVDPHQGPRLVGLALVFDVAELVPELAVFPLVVVVELHLPHRLKLTSLRELEERRQGAKGLKLT